MTTLEFVSIMTGRAMRAHQKSMDIALPKAQRDFHAGRREAYLQAIAIIAETEVSKIRDGILGTSHKSSKDAQAEKYTPSEPFTTFFLGNGF